MPSFDAIESLVTAGNKKIQAIKEFRAATGVGLKDAKDAVEYFEAHRRWPAQYLQEPEPEPEPEPPSTVDPRLHVVEQHLAQGRLIHAVKDLRELTRWGLKDSKEAVDAYRASGRWPSNLLAMLGESSSASAPAVAPTPVPTPASSGPAATVITAVPTEVAILKALARMIGYAPDVLLRASARRVATDGQLVVLRDRTCFMGEDRGQWIIDPVLSHDAVVSVEVHHGMRATLYVSLGYLHERFEMDPKDADAALALLRVYAR